MIVSVTKGKNPRLQRGADPPGLAQVGSPSQALWGGCGRHGRSYASISREKGEGSNSSANRFMLFEIGYTLILGMIIFIAPWLIIGGMVSCGSHMTVLGEHSVQRAALKDDFQVLLERRSQLQAGHGWTLMICHPRIILLGR